MPRQQVPFTLESFEASKRAEYGWSDRLPTLADLPGMLKDLADETELGDTSRSKHLAEKIQRVTFIVEPILSKKKHRRRNTDQVEVITYRDGRRTAIVHRADGTTSIRSHGLRRTVEADQLCSDLEITFRLCRDLLRGIPDPMRPTRLRTLSERFEANEQPPRRTVIPVNVAAVEKDQEPFIPTPDDIAILQVLKTSVTVVQVGKIGDRLPNSHPLGSKALALRLVELEKAGMVRRPHGVNKGVTTTEKGLTLLRSERESDA